jgi:serine/threonine-protein kinase
MDILGGRYELVRILGEGAMGVVWYGRDRELGIAVAVKTLRPEQAESPRARASIVNEAEICARMMSPHAVKVLGCSPGPGLPYVVYEALEGETLADRIAREGTLAFELVQEIVVQVSRALGRAHSLGVVHRDVKPENIFLTREPSGRLLVKLLDFGVARAAAQVTDLAGTPEYMAPEVLCALSPADARADLFALAVVAYECLTGRSPFAAESVAAIRALLGRDAAPVSDHRVEAGAAIDVWMHRALHRDPARRFQSAKRLAEAFADAFTADELESMPLAA